VSTYGRQDGVECYELCSCDGIIPSASFGYYEYHRLPQRSLDYTQIWAIKRLHFYAVVFNSKATHTVQKGAVNTCPMTVSDIHFKPCHDPDRQAELYLHYKLHPLHAPFWRKVLEGQYHYHFHMVEIVQHNQAIGILTYYEKTFFFLRVFYTAFQSIATDNQVAANAAVDYYQQRLAAPLTFGQAWVPLERTHTLLPIFDTITRYDFTIDLEGVKDPWTLVKSKEKNLIRKCVKNGVTSSIDLDIQAFYPVYARRMDTKLVSTYTREFFLAIAREASDYFTITANLDEQVIGAIFCIMEGDRCFYFAGGIDESLRLPINYFLIWEMIRHCHGIGMQSILMGESSMGSSVYKFKKKFGVPKKHTYVVTSPRKFPSGLTFLLFNKVISLATKLPFLPRGIYGFLRYFKKVI
jgi:hypothetical protein